MDKDFDGEPKAKVVENEIEMALNTENYDKTE